MTDQSGDSKIAAARNLQLLKALIAESGLPNVAFARALGRDEKSMRRWLSGENALPETLVHQLRKIIRIEATANRVTITIER